VSLRVNNISTLSKGTTYAVRLDHYDRMATLFIYADKPGSQANVRTARVANGQTTTQVNDVLGAQVHRGKRVRVDLPLPGNDGLDPYVFVDCTAGILRVDVLSTGPFDGQVRG